MPNLSGTWQELWQKIRTASLVFSYMRKASVFNVFDDTNTRMLNIMSVIVHTSTCPGVHTGNKTAHFLTGHHLVHVADDPITDSRLIRIPSTASFCPSFNKKWVVLSSIRIGRKHTAHGRANSSASSSLKCRRGCRMRSSCSGRRSPPMRTLPPHSRLLFWPLCWRSLRLWRLWVG